MASPATPVGEVFRRTYEQFAERPALRDASRQLTYAELGEQAHRFANGLLEAGIEPGSRAMLIAPNSCEWVIADQGLALGGNNRVGVLPRLHSAEIAQIAEDLDPAAVLVDAVWAAENGLDWIPAGVERVYSLGAGAAAVAGAVPLADLLAAASTAELPPADPDADVWIMYTSGSTGLPKGVLASQSTVGAHLRNGLHEVEYRETDVALHTAPISHFSGSVHLAVGASGGLNVLEESFDTERVIALAEAGEVTVLPLVPTMITMVLEELARRGEPRGRLGEVRMIPYAGSAIQPDRAARAREYFGDVMTQFYGASESPLPITVLRPEDHVDESREGGLPRLASAGRVAEHVTVEIVDEERRPLPAGETGEIRVAGEQVSPGYWRQPEATAESFEDGWVYTGDVGYIDEDGYLFILDRRKDMIITGGFNVYPREVENAISTLPGVREVAVVGAPDERWGELITAVVALEPGSELEAEDVIAHCRDSIGGYKVPKRVDFVEELPKSGVGKILKTEIRKQLWADRERMV